MLVHVFLAYACREGTSGSSKTSTPWLATTQRPLAPAGYVEHHSRDDPPHPMWQCLAQAPREDYWQRVRSLAAAAGYVPGVNDLDPQFQKLVTERIAAGNPEREDSPAYLHKRLKQLEQENAALRKRTRPQEAVVQLTDIVTGDQGLHADFPQRCFAALDHLSALIEEASERGNLGLAHSTAHGKALAKILVLGAVVSKHGDLAFALHANEVRSWFAS